MGVRCQFATERGNGDGEPDESAEFATDAAWASFVGWVGRLDQEGDGWPALATLVEWGLSSDPDGVEDEVARLVAKRPGRPTPGQLGVAEQLLQVMRQRPDHTRQVLVEDGSDTDLDEDDVTA
jgi:hypothetical protein